jgi:hypothetical protein
MKRFRVRARGKNLLFNVDGELCRCGFIASHFLRAESAEVAGKAALIAIHQNSLIRDQQVDESGLGPSIVIESVEEIGWLAWQREKRLDRFDFFAEDDAQVEPT